MLKRGDPFGDYRVVSLLGQGGMGSVYLLESASGTRVAAKILDPSISGDHEARKRFLREAELALGVKHPNLVETYDVGEDPDTGLCYILMEFVPGGSLADRLKAGPLPIDEAIRITSEIASVLELAREKGIVHRDIKPANIMFGADGTAKLADLGIARGAAAGAETTTVTRTGMMMGTPAYMAPEQMFDAHRVDSRADIYSLGIVFYEMLTGVRPNKDDTVVELMAKAVKGERLPDVRKMRPEVSASVAKLISLMCEMKTERRVQTAAEVTAAIMRIMSGEELMRKRWTLGVALAVLALAGGAAAVYWGFVWRASPKDSKPAVAAKPAVATNAVAKTNATDDAWRLLKKKRIPKIRGEQDEPLRSIFDVVQKSCDDKVNVVYWGRRRNKGSFSATDISAHDALRVTCDSNDCRIDVHNNIVMITASDANKYKWIEVPRSDMTDKLAQTVIPRVAFKPPTTILDSIDFFRKVSKPFCDGFFLKKRPGRPCPQVPPISLVNCSFLDALDVVCQSVDYAFEVRGRLILVKPKPSALDTEIPVEAPAAYAEHKAKLEKIIEKIGPALAELMGGTLKVAIDDQLRKIVLSDGVKSCSVSVDGKVMTLPPTFGGFPGKVSAVSSRVVTFLADLQRFGHTEICADEMSWYLAYQLRERLGDDFDGRSKCSVDLSKTISGGMKYDPEMKLYNLNGESADGKAPELSGAKKALFAKVKRYWVFQQMCKRNDKAIAEYLKAWKREQKAGNLASPVSQDDVAALFSLAVGEDLFGWFTEHGMPSSRERTRIQVGVAKKPVPHQ